MARHVLALPVAALLSASVVGGCGSPVSECDTDADCTSDERCISAGGVLAAGGTCVSEHILRDEVGSRDTSRDAERVPDAHDDIGPSDTVPPSDGGPSRHDTDTRGDATDSDDTNVCPDGGCACQPDAVESCYTGPSDTVDHGVCSAGRRECQRDRRWSDCYGETTPASEEICDGLDNDCDGIVDEECDCTAGETRPCGPSTGACEQGTQTCTDGSWGNCQNNVAPSSETCDGTDNDCDGSVDEGVRTTFYFDGDGDGYGTPNKSKSACSQPTDHVANDDDCYDQNARAKPGQKSWFANDRGDGSFDYDCDGAEEKRRTDSYNCSGNNSTRCSADPAGWQGGSPPPCGKSGGWIASCRLESDSDSCSPQFVTSRVQECR